jgi:hypothetical protein
MDFSLLIGNFLNPPVLFFFLGIVAVLIKTNLEIPPQIVKFLSIYLLFDIGFKGGEELHKGGLNSDSIVVMIACILFSFFIPFFVYTILKKKLNPYDAGAVSASYGSVSAVTFATAISFLESKKISFGGYMVANMALMESPAVIAGLILITKNTKDDGNDEIKSKYVGGFMGVLKESLFNSSVFLLIGSLLIGTLVGKSDHESLKPFVSGIFKGMLCLYMLDMGIVAANQAKEILKHGFFLIGFALLYPLFASFLGIVTSIFLNMSHGDALLLTVLLASASYIAVPAAMRFSVPEANMSILLSMALGVTFTFNVTIGIPLYNFMYTKLNWWLSKF